MDTPPMEDIQKRQFLKVLKEPLRSSFALLDFSNVPLTEVINRALNLDHQNIRTGLALFQGLTDSSSQPTAEETQFRKATQCTLCLQFGHSNLECTQQCALYQSKVGTKEWTPGLGPRSRAGETAVVPSQSWPIGRPPV